MRKIQLSRTWMVVIGCVTAAVVFYLFDRQRLPLTTKQSTTPAFLDVLSKLHTSSRSCNKLVEDWSKFNLSEQYYRLLPSFERSFAEAVKHSKDSEGHSGQIPELTRVFHLLASSGNVKTVCETGFNYGHSSFNYLTANKELTVHSFDLGAHTYAKKMAEALKEIFKSRINVHFGDSSKTVPEVKASGTLPLCDLILVDGGHNYPVAKADLINFGSHAKADNLVLFDDYPTKWGAPFGKAWEEMIVKESELTMVKPLDVKNRVAGNRTTAILELMRCSFEAPPGGLDRGFTMGKYVSIA